MSTQSSGTTRRFGERVAARGPGLLLPLLLGAAVIVSAVLVVQIKNDNRQLNNDSNQLRDQRERLDVEYSQLKIEEAAHSSHARIETLARDQIKMVEPRETIMVPGITAVPAGSAP